MMLAQKTKRISIGRRIAIFMAILGPGIITGSVDNDAGGITTYSVAGAVYGYNMLWTLLPAFIVLIVVQEMNARMGIVTGKGLADLIRENARVKLSFLIFAALLLTDLGNTTTEFAGVAGSMAVFGVSNFTLGLWSRHPHHQGPIPLGGHRVPYGSSISVAAT